MARDIDFVRRPKPKTAEPAKPRPKKAKAPWQLAFWLIIAGLIALGLALYLQFSSAGGNNRSQQPAENSSQDASQTTVGSNEQRPDSLIQIYNSGAGEQTLLEVINHLESQGYTVENLANSQFEYDKTYIWYRKGLVTLAEQIAKALPERSTALKETQISGAFDILIYLGRK